MVGGSSYVNNSIYEAGKLVLLSDSEMDQIENELWIRGQNSNNTKKQEIHDKIKKYFKDKVPNVTAEDMNIKALSYFIHTVKCNDLEPDVSL